MFRELAKIRPIAKSATESPEASAVLDTLMPLSAKATVQKTNKKNQQNNKF